jgi:hypothetical protein
MHQYDAHCSTLERNSSGALRGGVICMGQSYHHRRHNCNQCAFPVTLSLEAALRGVPPHIPQELLDRCILYRPM